MKQHFEILEELLDAIEQLGQRRGSNPGRGHRSSSRTLRRNLATFTDECRQGAVSSQARQRRSGELFRQILSLNPEVWTK